jgi:uncharacterized membrane protein
MLLLLNAFATCFMTGLIWFVQIVHYPLFAAVGANEFKAYETAHQRLTTYVVAPVMILELLSAALLVLPGNAGGQRALSYVGLLLVLMLWTVTAFVQVPLHNQLTAGLDADAVSRLVRSNWVRTALWSVRSVLALWMLHHVHRVVAANG